MIMIFFCGGSCHYHGNFTEHMTVVWVEGVWEERLPRRRKRR